MPKSTDPVVVLLRALVDPAGLAIVCQLATAGQVCACDCAARHDLAQPTLSHCLRDRGSRSHAIELL